MEHTDKIQKLWELHIEGMRDILKVYTEVGSDIEESFEESFIGFESSISKELGVAKKALNIISVALKEISEDLAREAFYLEELRNSEDPQYHEFISREYGVLLQRLLHNHKLIEENYKILTEKKESWKIILQRLHLLVEIYPHINEKIRTQVEILEEIVK
jgi:hypothetical protein